MRVVRGFVIAAISVTIALLLTLFFTPLRLQFKFLLFFLAVFASATEGVLQGVFAILLSVGMADYFLLPPLHSFSISDRTDLIRTLLFCGAGLAVVWITQRIQRSEEAIRATAAVIDSSADSIMLQSLDNTILSWNKAAEQTYGYTAKEAIGRPISVIIPLDRRQELQQLIERVHQGGSVKNHETVGIRKDGAYIDVALTLSPVQDRKGKTIGVSSIAREITSRKREAEELRQSHEKLERQTDQLRLLAEMSELLHASSIPADAYEVTIRFAQALVPASSGALFVSPASKNNLEAVIRWGEPHPNEQDFLDSEECWALRSGRLHLVEDTRSGLLCRHLPEPPPASYLCAPMIAHGETLGMLHLRMNRPNQDSSEAALPISLELEWLAGSMAERLASALADMRLRETLRAQSICDPLTGWFNRRFMEETLEREIRRAARNRSPLAVIMLDVDNFKEFNDAFGHEAGDVALKDLCQMLKTQIRSEDVACRYGGDEFVLVLPDTSAELAAQRSEVMRATVGNREVRFRGQLLRPTRLSIGIATFPADGRTTQDLLRASDTALYRAKNEGRDRVRLYGQESLPAAGT
jgi:diguanylate cyclase (GGDEF)-like protein/PAS domain S-box-containing protein